MFALTCPHCKHEIQTKIARPGATVKCIKCQKTFLLDARNTREIFVPSKVALLGPDGGTRGLMTPVAGESAAALSGSHQSSSKLAMAAMREMTEEMGELVPEVDIYSAAPTLTRADGGGKVVKIILAVALLVAVLAGAVWVLHSVGLIGEKTPHKQPAPPTPDKPTRRPDGTLPAQDF